MDGDDWVAVIVVSLLIAGCVWAGFHNSKHNDKECLRIGVPEYECRSASIRCANQCRIEDKEYDWYDKNTYGNRCHCKELDVNVLEGEE